MVTLDPAKDPAILLKSTVAWQPDPDAIFSSKASLHEQHKQRQQVKPTRSLGAPPSALIPVLAQDLPQFMTQIFLINQDFPRISGSHALMLSSHFHRFQIQLFVTPKGILIVLWLSFNDICRGMKYLSPLTYTFPAARPCCAFLFQLSYW